MGLTVEVVLEAGVELAMSEGLASVGMRPVANLLGVTPMALYRHVVDVESLQAAVVERLLDDLPEVSNAGAWDQRCREWAQSARIVLGRAPGLARHVLLEWIHLPLILVALDRLVVMLECDGPPGVDAVAGANAVLTHVLMRAQADETVRGGGLDRDLSTLRSLRTAVPGLWAHRDEYRRARLDEHFTYGLDALLAGLSVTRRSP